MRNSVKLFADNMTGPFTEISTLRCTITIDYKNNTFYLIPHKSEKSYGVCFETKNSYSVKINGSNLGIPFGTVDGKTFWISVLTRPLTLDYTFSVYKNGKLFDTYRVVSEV